MYFSVMNLPLIGKLDRRVWLTLVIDGILVLGVMYLGWSPVRIVGMYYLEMIGVMTGFILFMSRNELWQSVVVNLVGLVVMTLLVTPWVAAAVSATGLFDLQNKRLIQIFEPYFDVGLYAIGVFFVQQENYRQIAKIGETAFVAYASYAASSLMFVPVMVVMILFTMGVTPNMSVAVVTAIVICRTLLEWMRKRRIRKAMKEAAMESGAAAE
jgi:4-amino-4-deoxy-L-arabinose transferase-like glycosyltransferase